MRINRSVPTIGRMYLAAVTPDSGSSLPLWLFVPIALVIVGLILFKRMR